MNTYPQKRTNSKPNGFFMFALEFKKKLIDHGHDIHNIRQVMELAAPHWDKLTSEEKEEFKTKAKTSNVEMTFGRPRKRKRLTCFGEDIDEMQMNLDIERETYENMVMAIKDEVTGASELGELDEKVFYFIATTTFCEGLTDVFPAELSIAKFSLKEGVFDDFQIRINPGNLPLGSTANALKKSQETHRYQLPPDCEGQSDFMTILYEIIEFLHPLDKIPIFYTEGNTRDNKIPLKETCKTFDKILYESLEDQMMSQIKIYPLEELFFVMQRVTAINKNRLNATVDPPFPSISYASDKLCADEFKYTTPGCSFHDDLDASAHCCLSKVRRYGYTLAKWCANGKRYELTEGRHFPVNYRAKNSVDQKENVSCDQESK